MQIANDILRQASLLSLQKDYQRCAQADWDKRLTVSLPPQEFDALACRIAALPLAYRSILYFRYCFNSSPTETEEALRIAMAVGKLRYLHELLSESMGLQDVLICDATMREVCALALGHETQSNDITDAIPHYSQRFRRQLHQIPAAQSVLDIMLFLAKRTAAVILICVIGFSTALVANAELREHFFVWVIQTFPQFSVFAPRSIIENTSLDDIELGYVPDGYYAIDTIELRQTHIFEYGTTEGDRLTISVSLSNKITYALDTENVQRQQIDFKGSEAFWWIKGDITYFLWQQDGFSCTVVGSPNITEMCKVAEEIKTK